MNRKVSPADLLHVASFAHTKETINDKDLQLIGLSLERPYLMQSWKLMYVKSAEIRRFRVKSADFWADFGVDSSKYWKAADFCMKSADFQQNWKKSSFLSQPPRGQHQGNN